MAATFIAGARLVDPATGHDAPGAMLIEDGLIQALGESVRAPENAEVIDARGLCLAPALIDIKARACEPADGAPETLDETLRAAARGGVGTLVLEETSGRGLASPEHIEWVAGRALAAPVRLLAAGAAVVRGELAEIGLMLRTGAALIGDGGILPDLQLARRVLAYAAPFETWVSLRAEDAALSAATVAHEGDLAARLGLPARPAIAERLGVDQAAALAELTGAKLLLDRITTREGLGALARARGRGLELAATAPISHLMFNAVDAGAYDTAYRYEPPLRDPEDRDALVDAVRDGRIDVVVSDHRPVSPDAKAHPFEDAAAGNAAVQDLLPALLTLAAEGRMSLLEALRPVTSAPADLLGLPQGRLAEGAPADLILFDPAAPRAKRPGPAHDAFSRRTLTGRLLMSFVEGAIIEQL